MGCETGFGGENHRFPTLYVTKKIKDKKGLAFYGCPNFKSLRDNDLEDGKTKACNTLSNKEFDKAVEKQDEKEKKIKQKRQGKKRDPSIADVRKHLEKIIKYHKQLVNDSIPSIYPILGPVNMDEEEGKSGDAQNGVLDKKLHTKQELTKFIR